MEIKKTIDINKILGGLLQKAKIVAIGQEGYFEKRPFTLHLDIQWSTKVPPGLPDWNNYPRDEINLQSPLGVIKIQKPSITTWNYDGNIEGKAVSFELNIGTINPTEKYIVRTILPVVAKDWETIQFPGTIQDKKLNYQSSSWLPLKFNKLDVDFYIIFYKKYTPCAVIEIELLGSEISSFQGILGSTRQLLNYLLGLPLAGSIRTTVSCSQGEIVQLSSHLGRSASSSRRHHYPPIPATIQTLPLARDSAIKLSPPIQIKNTLDAEVISRCLAKYINTPKLVAPLEYLLHSSGVPVEMYGAFCAIALEALTDEMESAGLLASVKPLEDSLWKPIRTKLHLLLSQESEGWAIDQTKIIRARIDNLNSPANSQKLTRPFDLLDITLTSNEKEAIKLRNKYLHEGRILHPNRMENDAEAWQEAWKSDMALYTAVNKLFLKYLGYSGAVFNWGDKPPRSMRMLFDFI